MNVGVVFGWLDPTTGGIATFQRSLLEGIRRVEPGSEHVFTFYTVGGAGDEGVTNVGRGGAEGLQRRLVTVASAVTDQFGRTRPPLRTPLERALARDGVQVVWFASSYAERCELPFLFTVFDVEYLRKPWYPEVSSRGEWEGRRAYFDRFVPKATRVIVPGPVGAEQVERLFGVPEERLLPLHHPTPTFALAAAAAEAPPFELLREHGVERPYLFYPAQYWAHKNHPVLLDALALLPERYQLVCVGSDKGTLAHLRGLAERAGVASRVRFLGFVSTEELVALYAHAHALTYPSRFGPENLPPLEACALGCPVVVAEVPGARAQLRDAALFVPPDDARGFADAVVALERDELRAEHVRRGRELAASRRVEDYVAGVLAFLDEFVAIRRAWP